jgi:hypothetical protein
MHPYEACAKAEKRAQEKISVPPLVKDTEKELWNMYEGQKVFPNFHTLSTIIVEKITSIVKMVSQKIN